MKNKVELEDWERLRYRMKEEGIEYCFRHYSNWEEIEDKTFHRLKDEFLSSLNMLEEYVKIKIKVLFNKIK